MKVFRAKVIVINEDNYTDQNTLKKYGKYKFQRIENHYFNEHDKSFVWNHILKSYPYLKKTVEIYERSHPYSKMYDGKEVVNYKEELIYTKK